jgi:hypothetical protein
MDSEPKTVAQQREPGGPIIPFLVKTVIVVVAIIGILSYINSLAEERVAELKETFGHVGGRSFWAKVEAQLESLADPKSDLTPEKKKRIMTQIRVISDRWRPFLNEAFGPLPESPSKP